MKRRKISARKRWIFSLKKYAAEHLEGYSMKTLFVTSYWDQYYREGYTPEETLIETGRINETS